MRVPGRKTLVAGGIGAITATALLFGSLDNPDQSSAPYSFAGTAATSTPDLNRGPDSTDGTDGTDEDAWRTPPGGPSSPTPARPNGDESVTAEGGKAADSETEGKSQGKSSAKSESKPAKARSKSDAKSDRAKRRVRSARDSIRDEDGRPLFRMPFGCGQKWRLTTYAQHNPEEKKIDFFREGNRTAGALVRASAAGTVVKLPNPGGVKIYHGQGWTTLSLHMTDIMVDVGDKVIEGQPIGRVGSVGTGIAHLHYEQIYDDNGDGYAATEEMKYPGLQGKKYIMDEDRQPVVKSNNWC